MKHKYTREEWENINEKLLKIKEPDEFIDEIGKINLYVLDFSFYDECVGWDLLKNYLEHHRFSEEQLINLKKAIKRQFEEVTEAINKGELQLQKYNKHQYEEDRYDGLICDNVRYDEKALKKVFGHMSDEAKGGYIFGILFDHKIEPEIAADFTSMIEDESNKYRIGKLMQEKDHIMTVIYNMKDEDSIAALIWLKSSVFSDEEKWQMINGKKEHRGKCPVRVKKEKNIMKIANTMSDLNVIRELILSGYLKDPQNLMKLAIKDPQLSAALAPLLPETYKLLDRLETHNSKEKKNDNYGSNNGEIVSSPEK